MNWIKDKNGAIVGRIVESDNNTQRAYDSIGIYLGVYNKSADVTLDRNGSMISRGNSLASLIWDAKN